MILHPNIVPHKGNNGIVWLKATAPIAKLPNRKFVAKLKNKDKFWRIGLQLTTTPSGDTLLYGSFDDLIKKTKVPK